jgi:hypothetical protein
MGPIYIYHEDIWEMRLRLFATISLLANIGLVALALRTGRGSQSAAAQDERTAFRAALDASRLKTNVIRIEVTLTNEAPPFHWSDVASEDFKQYVAGLRAIGCPPETVRDIIKAELTTLFLARRRAIVEPLQRQWWDIAARGGELNDEIKPYEEAIEKLSAQTLGKLDEYLGDKAPAKERDRRSFDPDAAFLPEEKRKTLEQMHEQFRSDVEKLRPPKGAKDTSELHAQREALNKQRWESVAKLLSPEEHEEYQLRRSRNAHEAQASTGFEGTPEEARAIARIYQQYTDPPDRLIPKSPDYAAKKAAADEVRRQREEAMKAALGPERYAQFKQGFDGNFRDVFRITDRYGLPRDAAAQAADVLRARSEALQNLGRDKAMAADERAQLELTAQQAARVALLQALGERALRTYERYHGPIVPVEDPASAQEQRPIF